MTIIIREIALSSVVVMMVMVSAAIVATDHTARVDEPIHTLWWLSEELILALEASSKALADAKIWAVFSIA